MNSESHSKLKYVQIYNHYKGLITDGVLKPGERLPTESEVCQEFDVSRITVTKAFNVLVNDGLIHRIQGGGTFVNEREAPRVGNGHEFISFIAAFNPVGREMDMIRGIENTVKNSGYLFSISNTNDDPDVEREILENMRDKAKGIILYPSRSNRNTDLFYKLMKDEYPIVFVDRYPFNVPCSYAVSDNRDGGYQVGKLFVEMGAKKIALIFHNITEFSSELERYQGFTDAVGECGLHRDRVKTISIQGKSVDADVHSALKQLLECEKAERVTHIFACNAIVATSIVTYLQESDITMPPDLIMASFDDINFQTGGIRTISVRQNHYGIGEEAGKILLRKLGDSSFYERRMKIPVEIIRAD